ncbi:thiosulfate oxidation carrier protein SoxY [Kaarinaea lacus]
MKRRTFLKGTLASGMLGVAASAGLLTPRAVLAAWPKAAFESKEIDGTLKALYGTAEHSMSGDIKIKAPDIAENGAVVPITISTGMKTDGIAVLVKENPVPLTCSYDMGDGAEGFVACRIKMGKTSDLIAVVKSGGKLHSAKKTIKVTIGGCGG